MNIKVIIPIFFSILVGFLFGKVIFNNYEDNTVNAFNEGEKLYFIEIGEYESEADVKKIKNVDDFLTILENDVYKVYVGITKNKVNSQKIKEFYSDTYNNISVREKYVDNETFIIQLKEYDKVVSIITKLDDLSSVQKIIFSNYEEMVLKSDSND